MPERGGTSGGDGVMAFAGVAGADRGDAAGLLLGRDPVAPFGPQGRVTDIAGGDLRCADVPRLPIGSDVDPAPDAPSGPTVPARVPLAFALAPDARAVDPEVKRTR
jgi:hypothetical protein